MRLFSRKKKKAQDVGVPDSPEKATSAEQVAQEETRDVEQEASAVKIQAIIRGKKARADKKKKSSGYTLSPRGLANAIGCGIGEFSDSLGKVALGSVDVVASGASYTAKGVALGMSSTAKGITNLSGAAAAGIVSSTPKATKATAAEVNTPTPSARWFSPREGWTCEQISAAAKKPPMLMPIRQEIVPEPPDTIGELEIEVLEAANLPNKDLGGLIGASSDPYAIVLVEGLAGRTSVVKDSSSPRWGAATSFRAFRFPVLKAYSCVYIALADCDASNTTNLGLGVDLDDPIGRVVLQLAKLTANTQYDAWFDLSYNRIVPPTGKDGCVRLRYTFRVESARARMLSYVKPLGRPPLHTIPLLHKRDRSTAIFAKSGAAEADEYDLDVLKNRVNELRSHLIVVACAVATIEDALFWRRGTRTSSVGLFFAWQLLISYPQYVPASFAVLGLQLLNTTYAQSVMLEADAVNRKPTFWRILSTTCRGGRPPTLEEEALDLKKVEEAQTKQAPAKDELAPVSSVEYWEGVINPKISSLDGKAVAEEAVKLLEREQSRIRDEVHRKVDLADDSIEEKLQKKEAEAEAKKVKGSTLSTMVSPVASLLSPVQDVLTKLVRPLRGFFKVLQWEDRFLTTWYYVGLVLLALVLALIPWGFILHYGLRLLGLLAFGPHMVVVGRKVDAARAAAREAERLYRLASKQEREETLANYRAALVAEAEKRIHKTRAQRAKRSRYELAKSKYLDDHPGLPSVSLFDVRTAAHIKYSAVADPSRSTVGAPIGESYVLAEGETGTAQAVQQKKDA